MKQSQNSLFLQYDIQRLSLCSQLFTYRKRPNYNSIYDGNKCVQYRLLATSVNTFK